MREVFLGEYIKQRRLELGLTQEQVCEGICEPITISRMENGRQTPSRNRINAILHRLGLPEDKYFALLSKHEMEIDALQKEIVSCNIRFRQAQSPEKQQIFMEGMKKIQKLEAICEKNDQITKQFILRSKVILGRPEGSYPLEEQLKLLLEAIHLTVPRFDLEEISSCLYSLDETKIIIEIANVYSQLGQHRKAVDILSQLLKYIQKHYSNILQSGGHLPFAAHNYALELFYCKRYDEAIETAQLGWESCVKFGHYQFLPGIIHIMAECYHFAGNDKKSLALFHQAYYIYLAIDNTADRKQLMASVKEYFDFTFLFLKPSTPPSGGPAIGWRSSSMSSRFIISSVLTVIPSVLPASVACGKAEKSDRHSRMEIIRYVTFFITSNSFFIPLVFIEYSELESESISFCVLFF